MRERLVDAVDEQRAVGQAGQRVVVGLVLELALELAQLPDGLLEAVVLERDRGVVGERLEQAQVGVGELAHDAGAVGEQHRADHARLAREHREHRVGDAALLQVAAQALAAGGGRDAGDRARRGRPARAARRRSRRRSAASRRASSPGPWVVRSGALPSDGNRTISAISARNASSERASSPSSAPTISGERESVRVVS